MPAEIVDNGFQITAIEFAYIGQLVLNLLKQTCGHDGVPTLAQLLFDLLNNLRVFGSLLGKQQLLLVVEPTGIHIHRQTNHTEIVLQEILA